MADRAAADGNLVEDRYPHIISSPLVIAVIYCYILIISKRADASPAGLPGPKMEKQMNTTFKTPTEAYRADYLYALVVATGRGTERDGEIIGYYKTRAGAERAAAGMEYAVLKTEHLDGQDDFA